MSHDTKTVDDIPSDPMELVKAIAAATSRDASYKVHGSVPRDSALGTVLRLRWVSFTDVCAPECWDLHCPTPALHARQFRVTTEGWTIIERLDTTRVTRGSER